MAILPIRVTIADDHPAVVVGVASQVVSREKFLLTGSACNSSELLSLLNTNDCDFLIMDYLMPGGIHSDGMELIAHIRCRFPNVKIVIFTMIEAPRVFCEMLARGVTAIVSKADATSHLTRALDVGITGDQYFSPTIQLALVNLDVDYISALTRQESEILHRFASGMPVGEIASHLNQDRRVVNKQKRSAMKKLGIETLAALRLTWYGGIGRTSSHTEST